MRISQPSMAMALLAGAVFSTGSLAEDVTTAPASDAATGQVTGVKISSHPDWFKESFLDIAEDVDEAAGEGKHVILFLEMNGCPYCYKMLEENFKGAPYKDFIQENFEVIALNVRGDREVALNEVTSLNEKQLAEQLGVRYTPTVVFLNADNEPVARVNGYRNVDDFKQVLDYVASKSYEEQSLADYLDAQKVAGRYALRDDPQIQDVDDLSQVTDKPLALLIEDQACVACDALHDGHLADPEVRKTLESFTLVRLDAQSESPIKGLDGAETTPKQIVKDLGVNYRPTLVLFDQGKEIARIDGMLYRFHFNGILEYVGQGYYKEYPAGPFEYINAKVAKLTAAGQDVSISDE